MVLLYHVDVHALPGSHQDKIMQLVNTCYKEPIEDLDLVEQHHLIVSRCV